MVGSWGEFMVGSIENLPELLPGVPKHVFQLSIGGKNLVIRYRRLCV